MDAVVIGGGHAGLAASQQLAAKDIEHVVLERGRIGETWCSQRWDSFTLNTPTWMNRLPGDGESDLGEPLDGFATHEQLIERLTSYAARWELPVREGAEVTSVETHADGRLRVHIDGDDPIETRSVVVASGIQNVPRLPPIAAAIPPSIVQLPALEYQRPESLADGAVLVVGAGQTGGQLTEELVDAGREVFWSVSAVARVPRRYRGRDTLEWLGDAGFYEMTKEMVADPAELGATMPIISGVGRHGHTLSLQWLASKGAKLIGRIGHVKGHVLGLDDSVEASVRFADEQSAKVRATIDRGITDAGMVLPEREPDEADEPYADDGSLRSPGRLDMAAAGITTIIWATGVTGDFSYLPLEAVTPDGQPAHELGASPIPGIDYIGLPWLMRRNSGIINGIARDAAVVADRVLLRARGEA